MKNYIKNILKRSSINIIAIIIALGTAITYASITSINWPTTTPNGEVEGGKFMVLFNKILSSCPDGQAIKGYAPNGDKICMDLSAGGLIGGLGGSGTGEIWEEVNLASTEDFDLNCKYRVFLDTSSYSTTSTYANYVGINPIYYPNSITNNKLGFTHAGAMRYIDSTNKGVMAGTYSMGFSNPSPLIISKIEQDCNSSGTEIINVTTIQVTESCSEGEALQGYTSTGAKICIAIKEPTPIIVNTPNPTNTGALDDATQDIIDFYAGTIDEAGPSCEPGVLTERCYHLRLAGKTFKFIQTINGFHQDYTITYYTQFTEDGYYVYNGKAYNPPREDEAEQQEIKKVRPPVVNYYTEKAIEDAGLDVEFITNTLFYHLIKFTDMEGNIHGQDFMYKVITLSSGTIIQSVGNFLCYHPSKATSYMDYTTNEGKEGYFMGAIPLKGDPFDDNLQYWDPVDTSWKDLNGVDEVTYISPYACSDVNNPYLAP